MIELPIQRDMKQNKTRSGLSPEVEGHVVVNNMLIEAQFRYDRRIGLEPTYLHLLGNTYSLFGDDKFDICSYILSHDGAFMYLLVHINNANFIGLRRLENGNSSLRTIDGHRWLQPKHQDDDHWQCEDTWRMAKLVVFVPARDNLTHLKLKEDVIPMADDARKKRLAEHETMTQRLASLEQWDTEEEKEREKDCSYT